ncbi:TPA: IS30 family transposase [Staphylococcus aureus]|nr:IS30 family transposase [Staphylococcus aureus]
MEVVKREEFGHYEIDTIWSKRPSRYCLLTILERKTITIDRGKEFAKFELIERELNCSVYFSDPGCPYQRGSIEQVNGLLRQYFPKDTDFVNVSDIDVEIAVLQINQRPRMKQNYKTSEYMRMLEYN